MILALDFGSTAFKAAIVDRRLRVRGLVQQPVQHHVAAGGRVELAVEETQSALRRAVDDALKTAGTKRNLITAVAVTSQAQTFTVIDPDGQARLPFISWQDNRAASAAAALVESSRLRGFGRHCSFGALWPALQVAQLFHLHQTRPDCVRTQDCVVNLPTFFVREWTGVAAVDVNLAAMSGLYSLELGTWWPAALRACQLQPTQLPQLLPIGAIAGHTRGGRSGALLPAGIPVVLAGNDQTAGAYAARLDRHRGLLVTLGTAQVVFQRCSRLPPVHPGLVRGPFPRGGYYRMAADACGGNVINWAETVLAGCASDATFFAQAARASAGQSRPVFELDREGQTAAWRNLARHHTAGDLAYAVLEALTHRIGDLVRRLGPSAKGVPVLAAGGGSASRLWIDLLSCELNASVKVVAAPPFLGAARLALAALNPDRRESRARSSP